MQKRDSAFLIIVLFMLLGMKVDAQTITSARYADPVERYGHFALDRPHEYARLTVETSAGRELELELPDDEVFEDLAPRIVRMATGQGDAILTIVSNRFSGARLALFRLSEDALVVSAQSPPIGSPMRWLNPVGVADLDGDGRAEVAAVITPHIGGNLKIYRQDGDALVEVAVLAGFSNHVYRSSELALSMPMSINGQVRLLVPDRTRRFLRVIALRGETLVEIGRCALAEPLTGAIAAISAREVAVNHPSGSQIIAPHDCPKSTR